MRNILGGLDAVGILDWSGRRKRVLRGARRGEYFPARETASATERLSSRFMEHILSGRLAPGTPLPEAELARLFGVSTTVVREFLIRFSRFGLIAKEPNRHWTLRGFTRAFAEELFEVRELFELRAFASYLAQGQGAHADAIALRAEHAAILIDIDRDYLQFPQLDERFHRVWIERHGNRFMLDFFEMISLLFHYHYRWNRRDEKDRNCVAITEHLAIIGALEQGAPEAATHHLRGHLDKARETLLSSVQWGDGDD